MRPAGDVGLSFNKTTMLKCGVAVDLGATYVTSAPQTTLREQFYAKNYIHVLAAAAMS